MAGILVINSSTTGTLAQALSPKASRYFRELAIRNHRSPDVREWAEYVWHSAILARMPGGC
jgi:hypothetical protein